MKNKAIRSELEQGRLSRRRFGRLAAGLGLVAAGATAGCMTGVRKPAPGTAARERQGLKDLAPKGFHLGTAASFKAWQGQMPDKRLYQEHLAREFNTITLENELKFGPLAPHKPGRYRWEYADELLDFAAQNNLQVRGHTLVWYFQLPDWFAGLSKTMARAAVMNHIEIVVGRYAGRRCADGRKLIYAWDVVNEALKASYVNPGFREADPLWSKLGDNQEKLDFIIEAFARARAADPEAKLYYNDFSAEEWGWPKTNTIHRLVRELRVRGAEIDGVGIQAHLQVHPPLDLGAFGEYLRRLGNLGVEVQVTELDVRFQECTGTLEDQAAVYAGVLEECLARPEFVTGLSLWGFTDRHHWLKAMKPCDPVKPVTPCTCPGFPGATIMDQDYRPKPAYHALARTLTSRAG